MDRLLSIGNSNNFKLAFQSLKTRQNIKNPSSVLVPETNLNRPILYARCYSTDQIEPDKIPESVFLEALETTSTVPWLWSLDKDPAERLKRAYSLIFQIVMYIARPKESEEAGQQYLVVSPLDFRSSSRLTN